MSSIQSSNGAPQAVCSRCEQFDETLASIIDEGKEIPAVGLPLLSLGYRSRRTDCKMCQFLLNLAPNYKRNYKLHVRLFDRFKLSPGFSTRTALSRSRFPSALREHKPLAYDYRIEAEIVQSGVLVYSTALSGGCSEPSGQILVLVLGWGEVEAVKTAKFFSLSKYRVLHRA